MTAAPVLQGTSAPALERRLSLKLCGGCPPAIKCKMARAERNILTISDESVGYARKTDRQKGRIVDPALSHFR